MLNNLIKLFLRLALAASFLSAVADRFGWWGEGYSVWGNWGNFIEYTKLINPWFPESMIGVLGAIATGAEVLLAVCLLAGFKTEWAAKASAILLLIFGLSMTFSTGVKGALDYSVFSAAAGALALGQMKSKFLEVDSLL